MPLAWNTFECVYAAVVELDAGADDEIPHRARNDRFAGSCLRHDAGGEIDREAADVSASQFDLPRMESGSNLDAERADLSGDPSCASDRARPTVERRDDAAPGRRPASSGRHCHPFTVDDSLALR
jgi:hypothetical protein